MWSKTELMRGPRFPEPVYKRRSPRPQTSSQPRVTTARGLPGTRRLTAPWTPGAEEGTLVTSEESGAEFTELSPRLPLGCHKHTVTIKDVTAGKTGQMGTGCTIFETLLKISKINSAFNKITRQKCLSVASSPEFRQASRQDKAKTEKRNPTVACRWRRCPRNAPRPGTQRAASPAPLGTWPACRGGQARGVPAGMSAERAGAAGARPGGRDSPRPCRTDACDPSNVYF